MSQLEQPVRIGVEAAIVVVAKAPHPGKVKTRLCPPFSYEQAADLFTGFLLDTIELASKVVKSEVKAVCPTAQDALELTKILPATVGYVVQPASGLSDALLQAFSTCLAAGYSKVLCISSDNPTLPVAYLEEALHILDDAEVVLGPSEDGGYYLIGAKAVYPALFENMVWSTASVLSETLERATRVGLQTQLLPWWYDLDTSQELKRFIQELGENQAGARHTRERLGKLGVDFSEL